MSSIDAKLHLRNLAPTDKLSIKDMLIIFNTIFGLSYDYITEYTKHFDTLCSEYICIESTKVEVQANKVAVEGCLYLDNLVIETCECSLHGKLALFVSSVCEVLKPNEELPKVIMEYKIFDDRKYSVDGAVVLKGRKPVVVYELKQKVSPQLLDQNDYDLCEFFLRFNGHTKVMVLSDRPNRFPLR